jgi:hypothetical protein
MPDTQLKEVIEHYQALPSAVQEQVLALLRDLDRRPPQGVPGRNLLQFAGSIPASDLESMSAAIERGCERVEPDAW